MAVSARQNIMRLARMLWRSKLAESSYDKVVVHFFGKALPIEYELTRSVQTAAQKERFSVGILTTDAGLMSGGRELQIVTELKRQYNVEEVSPATPIDAERFDVLLESDSYIS